MIQSLSLHFSSESCLFLPYVSSVGWLALHGLECSPRVALLVDFVCELLNYLHLALVLFAPVPCFCFVSIQHVSFVCLVRVRVC